MQNIIEQFQALIANQDWTEEDVQKLAKAVLQETQADDNLEEFCEAIVAAVSAPVDAETLQTMLELVLETTPTVEEIEAWTDEQKTLAEDWSVSLHMTRKGDTRFPVPDKPGFLADYQVYDDEDQLIGKLFLPNESE